MRQALALAREAGEAGEIPVGAVVVRKGEIIGQGRNRREELGSALAHAEIEAIHHACERLGDWRLTGCHLYVTLEPCPMCMGAAVNARIQRVIFGAEDEAAGCCGSLLNFPQAFGNRPEIYRGFLESECREVLTGFFLALRKKS